MVLLGFSLLLFGYLAYGDYREAKETKNKKALRYQGIALLSVGGVLFLSWILYRTYPYYADMLSFFKGNVVRLSLTVVFAFAISYFWFVFFRALDIFEREKWAPILLTFVMACSTPFLVFPISAFLSDLGLALDGSFLSDFAYCVLGIGVPEELVKIIPFLLMLRFSKHINEPYDYILYGGACALGFAFVENVLYLTESSMFALTGRAFYASVAHVFDTSIIAYTLAIAHYKGKNQVLAFLKGFGIAALAHGFYDFWLISDSFNLPLITIFFFLASIHFLTMMINNTLNISPYFKPERRLRAAKYKFYLTAYLLLLCAAGFLYILFTKSPELAMRFAADTAFWQSYTLVYLVVSLTSLNIVHGHLMQWGNPRSLLLPLINRYPNYLELTVKLDAAGYNTTSKAIELLKSELPIEGVLSKRVVVEGNFNWYYFTSTHFPERWKPLGYQLIVCPARFRHHLLNGKIQTFRLAFVKNEKALGTVEFLPKDLRPLGNGKVSVV